MSFLLDTDTCSFHLKKNGALSSRFLQYMGRLSVSVLTAGELFTWALRAKAAATRLQSLLDLLDDVQILDLDLTVARRFGELRAALLDAGRPTPTLDLLIAAAIATMVAYGQRVSGSGSLNMLKSLEHRGVGPAEQLSAEFGSRLNEVTGDNGLVSLVPQRAW